MVGGAWTIRCATSSAHWANWGGSTRQAHRTRAYLLWKLHTTEAALDIMVKAHARLEVFPSERVLFL
jgi:hypothetical protein